MKIVIIGAGQVGATLAAHLVKEKSEITVIDTDLTVLKNLQERLDISTVHGNGAHPKILKMAGADDADMLIAATNSDEVNMIACQVAYSLFRIQMRIARIRAREYLFEKEHLFNNDAIPINVFISPELLVTHSILKLLEYPDALHVTEFADGKALLVSAKASNEGLLINRSVGTLKDAMPGIPVSILAIFRADTLLSFNEDTVILENDEIYFLAARQHVCTILSHIRAVTPPTKRVMIAGGGHIGISLAETLEQYTNYEIKLIEHNPKQIENLTFHLNRTLILQGDCADGSLLLEENVDEMDVFCAVTNRDEANIVSGLLAKRLGARKALILVSQSSYVEIIEGGEIDIAISPHLITMGGILSCIRRADVLSAHSLRSGTAEAMELAVHPTSKVAGKALSDIALPAGAVLAAIVRDETIIIPMYDTTIEVDDHVIVFLADKEYVHEVERLFEVNIGFF